MKVIKINGFRGLLTALFIGICMFAGFVLFPAKVAMHLWNLYLVTLYNFPTIDMFQGILLWGIIAISYYILSKGSIPVSFQSVNNELSDAELNMIMKNAKIYSGMKKQAFNKKDVFIKSKENLNKKTEVSSVVTPPQTRQTNEDIDEKITSEIK